MGSGSQAFGLGLEVYHQFSWVPSLQRILGLLSLYKEPILHNKYIYDTYVTYVVLFLWRT